MGNEEAAKWIKYELSTEWDAKYLESHPVRLALERALEVLEEKDREGKAMATGIKPCPFCGKEISLLKTGFGVMTLFQCKNPDCHVLFGFPFNRTAVGDEKGKAWNKRAQIDESIIGARGNAD